MTAKEAPKPAATVFDGNDAAYQAWLVANPRGYVVNTRRSKRPAYMVLHRADCATIRRLSGMARRGGFTERSYIKVCAVEIGALRDWVRRHDRADGSFSTECSLCCSVR
jgi:hypothetical protein